MTVEVVTEGNMKALKIIIPISPRASKTGKSTVIAGTNGFTATTATHDGQPVKVNVNAII